MCDWRPVPGRQGYRRTAADGAEIFRAGAQGADIRSENGFGAAQSFAATVVDLADPSTEEFDKAVKLLGPTLDNGKSDRELASTWASYYVMSRLQRRRGKWQEANAAAQRAASHALQQFSAIMDEPELLKQAETFVPVFEDIACILAKVGAGRWILSNCPGRSCAIGSSKPEYWRLIALLRSKQF